MGRLANKDIHIAGGNSGIGLPAAQEFDREGAPVAVKLDHVTRTYRRDEFEVRALDDISLAIPTHAFVAIMGPSGSGKTTLLNLVAGIDHATSGSVVVGEDEISTMSEREPASVFVAFKSEAYTVTKGEITKFDSTLGKTRRGFCARCGSSLTCETLPQLTETHFHVGAFDQAALLQPTKHYFSEERLPWLHTSDA